jgi:serine/threonine protein kinase
LKVSKTQFQVNNERKFLSEVCHPSIIRLLGTLEDESTTVLVLPWAEGGSVIDLFENNASALPEDLVRKMAHKILNGLNYLHEEEIWHRDIKLDNILIMGPTFTGDNCVLADFGFAKSLRHGQRVQNRHGTLQYSSPEELNKQFCDHKTDIWSLGISLLTCLTGHFPFYSTQQSEIWSEIASGLNGWLNDETLKGISSEAIDLIGQMLDPNPTTRISAAEALKHDWFLEESREC